MRQGVGVDRTGRDTTMWPDRRLIDLFGIELPFVQAPMAGAMDHELAAAAAEAGALGSLPCAMLSEAQVREQSAKFRALTGKPLNLNFFCHVVPVPNNEREARWRDRLAPYYRELAIDPAAPVPDQQSCRVRCPDVRGRGRREARGRELPLRPAGRRSGAAGQGGGLHHRQFGHHGRRGALAGRSRRRRSHRAGQRGGRPPRHVPDRGPGDAGRHLRAGAAGGRCGEGAGDRRRCDHRCPRDRGRVRARRRRRADRQRLSVGGRNRKSPPCIATPSRPRATTAPS